MRENCAPHFAATLRILEPTLVIMQGEGVRSWLAPLTKISRRHTDQLFTANLAGVTTLLCAFTHPSAHGPLRSGDSLDATYLTKTIEPTIARAMGYTPRPIR